MALKNNNWKLKMVSFFFLLFSAQNSFAAKNLSAPIILNKSWYTMQAGSTPWGYYQETIEKDDEHYSYRYQMKKFEEGNPTPSEENIGAMSKLDLTPISLNIFKQSGGTTESVDATYNDDKQSAKMTVKISGSNASVKNRAINKFDMQSAHCKQEPTQCKSTMLDVFFPIYLSQNWSKLKPGFKDWISIFTEDPETHDFLSRRLFLEVKDYSTQSKCLNVIAKMEPRNEIIRWCTTKEGVLVEMDGPGFKVRKVSGEKEAKQFVAGLISKK